MRVSIVIPVYNGANYLAEAIDSALAQTYGDVEVLVVDDGSRDDGATERIARGYGERIRYIAKPNGGVASALNAGLREMTGEWFCWLSHDDRFLPEKTARQIAFAREHPKARIIGCDFDLIDERGGVTGEYRMPVLMLRTGIDVLQHWVFGCALMIHRSCLEATGSFNDGPFNEANRTTQDLEMWLALVEHHPFQWLPEILAQVRQHAEAGSRTETRYERDKNELFDRILARYPATFFDPAATTPRARAAVYAWLARNAMGRFAPGAARACARRAMHEWPSLHNPALALYLLGPRGWLVRNTIVARGGNLVKRLRRLGSSSPQP
jgi:glycosyltransferase involved in cell wall biosynthesis